MSKYFFGRRSLQKLSMNGLDPRLIETAHRALELTAVDFGVYDTLRTREEQRAMVDSGASWTMRSKHLTGKAIDIVPYVRGQYRWEWSPICAVGEAFRAAWVELYPGDAIRWGGCWCDARNNRRRSLKTRMEWYAQGRIALELPVRADGAHWEVK